LRPPRPNPYRDAWAGELRADRAGEEVAVAGWVHRRRDHGGLIFIDLRDRSGILQLVFHPEHAPDAHARAHDLRAEDVLAARGAIARREPQNVNPNLATGEVELDVRTFEKLADAKPPPFPIDEDGDVDETLRLRHRALDLRRERMRDALECRHTVIATIRHYLDARDFLEFETPILTRSTPEGARDFLVPARVRRGRFFALPQSPQLFKQLLMIAGFERYYQIARCFRDEDARADRLPEFTQLDVELSFVEEEDVIDLVEGLMAAIFEATAFPGCPDPPYPRLRYDDAMARYGTDRPDRRFGLEIHDLGEALAGTEFKVFASVLGSGGVVRGLNAGAHELARAELDRLTEQAIEWGAKGLVWAFVEEDGGWRSPIAKFLSDPEREAIGAALGATPGDLLLAVADRAKVAAEVLGLLRLELADRFRLRRDDVHDLLWVVDFPMFERDPETGTWDPLHHPFTAPEGDLVGDPAALRSRAYDLVCDGQELGGGSIRINRADVQRKVLELLRIGPEEAQERFGFLLDALDYGAPPHGGIAFGIDRLVALVAGRESIREVIPFPKMASGVDPLTGAPAAVDPAQLRELGIRTLEQPAPAPRS
jgi:aspartyl-tRNA synthetase